MEKRIAKFMNNTPSVSGYNTFTLSLTKFVEKIITFSTQDKFIMKIYSIIDLLKLIWYYRYYYIYL